jgi:hypothetical protein
MITIVATSNGNYNDFWTISGTYIDLKRGSFPQWFDNKTEVQDKRIVNSRPIWGTDDVHQLGRQVKNCL